VRRLNSKPSWSNGCSETTFDAGVAVHGTEHDRQKPSLVLDMEYRAITLEDA
jgi:hypothetical protein